MLVTTEETEAGALDSRGHFERPVTTPVGGGSTTTTWEALPEVWAAVKPLKGYEYYRAQQTEGGTTQEVTVRQPISDSGGDTVRPQSSWRWVEEDTGYGTQTYELTGGAIDVDKNGNFWLCRMAEVNE